MNQHIPNLFKIFRNVQYTAIIIYKNIQGTAVSIIHIIQKNPLFQANMN